MFRLVDSVDFVRLDGLNAGNWQVSRKEGFSYIIGRFSS